MQKKKNRLAKLSVVLALILVLGGTIITAKVLTEQENQRAEALRQELSAAIVENEALKPVLEDAQAYQKQMDTLTKITGDVADAANVSAGLSSSAMENAARDEGYVFPREVVFKDVNKQ